MKTSAQKESPLEHLEGLRNGFSDKIPTRIVHSDDPDNKYKVRIAWWTGVLADLANAREDGLITDPQIQKQVDQFIDDVATFKLPQYPLTTAQDIVKANSLIDIVLGRKSGIK